MSFDTLKSTNSSDYEILIRRRGETEYASYCPQINYMITGDTHEEVEQLMEVKIQKHIESIKSENKDSQ